MTAKIHTVSAIVILSPADCTSSCPFAISTGVGLLTSVVVPSIIGTSAAPLLVDVAYNGVVTVVVLIDVDVGVVVLVATEVAMVVEVDVALVVVELVTFSDGVGVDIGGT